MSPVDQLRPLLKKLRLSGVLETLDLRRKQAAEENLDPIEFLLRLLSDEVQRREAKQLELRLRRAQFEAHKTFEDFEFAFNPKLPRGRLLDLANCSFMSRKECVFLLGPAGVGKSHIAQAIGHRACRLGHRVTFVASHQMFKELRAARADSTYERKLLRFTNPDLLIIDDLGLRPLKHDAPEDLYEIVRQRYQRGSIVISSNRALEEFYPMFGDALLASAAMDRLLDNAHVIEMDGHSYRNPPTPHSVS